MKIWAKTDEFSDRTDDPAVITAMRGYDATIAVWRGANKLKASPR